MLAYGNRLFVDKATTLETTEMRGALGRLPFISAV